MTRVSVASRGRPESETDTPVNIENGLYRDNGEGVAARPLPYPLVVTVPKELGRAGVSPDPILSTH